MPTLQLLHWFEQTLHSIGQNVFMIKCNVLLQNLQPNHRGNDVMVLEDRPQVLTAKFMYGPLDMTSLSGEKVRCYLAHVHLSMLSENQSNLGLSSRKQVRVTKTPLHPTFIE